VHFKLFGTDGVSLQSQELSKALSTRGWRVLPCACDVPPHAEGLRLPELSYQSPDAIALRKRIFSASGASSPAPDGAALVDEITERARGIRRRVEEYVNAHQIRLLHIRNLMSLPYNLPATLALYDLAVDRPDIGFLMQHHDIYWEGPNAQNFLTPYRQVGDLMDRIMCPSLPNARHVLINPLAAEALRARKGLILDRAVKSAIALLMDHNLETRWTDENFTELGAFCGMDHVAAEYFRLYTELRPGVM